jgi:hypothetical protein
MQFPRRLSCLIAFAPFAVSAAPVLGTADQFAVLAGAAVTCTDASITGDVGVTAPTGLTRTNCTINGTVHTADPVAVRAYADFLTAYATLATPRCDQTLFGPLSGLTLAPGVYCVDAASSTTGGTLILNGPADAAWLFKVGTLGTGALTGVGFSVVTAGGARACNVTWRVAQAVTMTDSNFQGTVLAGADITVTRGTFNGDAFAGGDGTPQLPVGAVTLTGATLAGCEGSSPPPVVSPAKAKCNQGVGNGPESCDPGNSNQGNPARSNDERGGTPGNPGRKGATGK